MASSVAKLKPTPSVIPEPDEVAVQNMKENEVLAGLAGSADSEKKADILNELRVNARRNGGRLQFEDRSALFRVLRGALCDTNSNTRQRCLEFLGEVIPEFGENLDDCMSIILPQVVSIFGDSQVSVKRSAIQTLHMYMKHSSQVSAVLNAIITHGLESDDRKTRTEALVALPILIMPNLAYEDLFTLTKALVVRLETSSRPESSPAVISLERIKNVVGPETFENYLQLLTPEQKSLCLMSLENRTTESPLESEILGTRKAKSADQLSLNGIVQDERDGALDRAHTISGPKSNAVDDSLDAYYGPREFGFVPISVMVKLQDHSNWRIRAQGIEELKTLMAQLRDTAPVLPNLGALFGMLLDFLDDVNFKIGSTSLQIIGLLVAKLGVSVQPFLKPLLGSLASKLGDNKIVIRQENMKVLMQLMQILSPKEVLAVMTTNLQHRNSRVREETVNVVTAALLTFPSSDFDLPKLTHAMAPALVDSKRRVRQAALEAFAVIAQAMGAGRFQPVVSAIDAIELSMGGDGIMNAITARLARRQLPRLNRDGLVEYAVPLPSSGTIRGQTTIPRGSDIDWILAGTSGTGSADLSGSTRSTPGLNDSINLSGHSPRRILSAGKNFLPWEVKQNAEVSQPSTDLGDPKPPQMKLNSWAPAEIINDRPVKPGPQPRVSPLVSPKSKAASSYVEKFLAKNVQRASQVVEHQSASKVPENSPAGSYAEMHRAKVKKDKGKISGHTVPGLRGSIDSYALLYKRGTVNTKAKASSSAEPTVGEHTSKESAPRGSQSNTPTPFSLQSSPQTPRKAFPLSLSSSWPDWTEVTSQGRPWGRLSPVSHTVTTDLDATLENVDAEPRKNDIPQTPIHIKPQLARSASKSRGLRAAEFAELRKGDSQPAGIDFLDFSPSRPTQLAPVNQVVNHPPQESLKQVHKQAEIKRILKKHPVTSDSDDGSARTPSPLENSDPPMALKENTAWATKSPSVEESPFESRPRIARTPIHARGFSAETPLQLQSASPLPSKFSEPEVSGLGVAGFGILDGKGGSGTALSPLPNGISSADGSGKTSGIESSVSGRDEVQEIEQVAVVGHGLLKSELKLGASPDHEGGNQLEYETEESDEGVEDDDEEEEEEDEDEGEEEGEEEVEDDDEEEEEQGYSESGSEETSGEEQLTPPSDSQMEQVGSKEIESNMSASSETAPGKEVDSLGSSEDSGEASGPEIRGASENVRDMTPRTMRKSLSKSTRERMERRRLEEELRIQKEQQKMEELEKERARQWQMQRDEEERLRQKILKEQEELAKMFDRKEKEREAEKQKQRQLQEELQRQEKALRERLQKQQEELEEIEQEKQRERERQKERMKEKMRQKQRQKQLENEQKDREREEEIRRQLAAKEAELEKEKAQRLKQAAADAESKDLSVTGSSPPLKPPLNKKPSVGSSPKKKIPVSSAHSERDAGYVVTSDPQELRRHHAASASSTSSQCWEVSFDALQPFNNPDHGLRDALKYLANTEDWEMKCEGIQGIRRLSKHHTDTVASQIQQVTRAIVTEVKNLRSQVSRFAICCLGEMYICLGKHMDSELDVTAKILLSKAGESSGFIRDDVDKSLNAMVNTLNPTRVLAALVSGGASHRNVAIRKTTAQFLSLLAERMGPNRVMSGTKDVTEKVLYTAAQFLTDGGPETRYYGRKIIYTVCDHHDFDKLVAKYVPTKQQKTVRDAVETLRTKGLGDPPADLSSSARQRKRSGGVRSSLIVPPASSSSRESTRSGRAPHRNSLGQGEDVLPNLINSLQANDWKERLQALDQFVDLVQLNPDGMGAKFTKVFDAFLPRLQDSNSKVNVHALHCLPKILPMLANQSTQVIPPIVSVVASNLASKNPSIFSKAEDNVMELIKFIDNSLLVQPFCTTAQYGSSRVKPFMVERLADIVPTVWCRKPQLVSRHVLPVLWNLLGSTSNGSAGTGNGSIKSSVSMLANTLNSCMGKALIEQASGQQPRVQEKLHEIIASQH